MARGVPSSTSRSIDIEIKLDEILSLLRGGYRSFDAPRTWVGSPASSEPVFVGTIQPVQTNLDEAGVSEQASSAAALEQAVRNLRALGSVDAGDPVSLQEGAGGA